MTGEQLYELHRKQLLAQGVSEKLLNQDAKPPKFWLALDEKTRQAWDATAHDVEAAYIQRGDIRPGNTRQNVEYGMPAA